MREILFRGKRADNGEWVSGYYCRAFSQINGKDSVPAIQEVDCFYYRAVDPSTVGQYTGLTDKNSKKIFEGDIVKGLLVLSGLETYGVCEFRQSSFGVKWNGGSVVEFSPFSSICNIEFEVIGNIHDNPELLGVIS